MQSDDARAGEGSSRIPAPTDDPKDPARYWSTPGFGVVEEPGLRRLLDYWQSKRVGTRLPQRSAIDPLEIPWALDRIYLIDPVPPPAHWRYRLAGARIEEIFGVKSLRGALLTDLMSAEKARLVAQRWQPLIERGCIVYMHGLIYRTSDRLPVGGRLLLPLAEAGSEAVAGLVGMTDGVWRSPGGARRPAGLDIHYIPRAGR